MSVGLYLFTSSKLIGKNEFVMLLLVNYNFQLEISAFLVFLLKKTQFSRNYTWRVGRCQHCIDQKPKTLKKTLCKYQLHLFNPLQPQ